MLMSRLSFGTFYRPHEAILSKLLVSIRHSTCTSLLLLKEVLGVPSPEFSMNASKSEITVKAANENQSRSLISLRTFGCHQVTASDCNEYNVRRGTIFCLEQQQQQLEIKTTSSAHPSPTKHTGMTNEPPGYC